jgi:succinoglycan biosynthesis transport protein ExoP
MDLQYYLTVLWRRKWIIVITLVIIELVILAGTFLSDPKYSATTTIRIASASSGSVSSYDYMYADRLMNTYVKLATTSPVEDELKQRLGITELPDIQVATVASTELIQITAEYTDPTVAAEIANTLADILISKSTELYTGSEESSLEILSQQVSSMEQEVNQARTEYINLVTSSPENTQGIETAKQTLDLKQQLYSSILSQYEQTRLRETLRENMISVVDPAIPPEKPSKPNKILNIVLGLAIGGIGGVGLAFLFENFDTTLYTADQVEKVTKLPTIGKIPYLKRLKSFDSLKINFAYGESFRRLRTSILSSKKPVHSLLITSAEPKEGKSRIVADLAFMMVQSGRKVIAVDADMRAPTLDKIFNFDNDIGLSSILDQGIDPKDAIHVNEFPGVNVLTSGPLPTNPSELLGSNQMKILLNSLIKAYDIVIIDTPAALVVADVAILAPMVDAVALVVNRARTNAKEVNALFAQLDTDTTRWIGVIINRAELSTDHYYYRTASQATKNDQGSS